MSSRVELVLYLAVLAVLGAIFTARRAWRASRKPRLGDADAYKGNLVVPPPRGQHGRHRSHGGLGHHGGTAAHGTAAHGGHHGGAGHHGHIGGHHGGAGHH